MIGASGYALLFPPAPVASNTALRQSDITASSTYRFIDPLVGLQTAAAVTPPEFRPIESEVNALVQSEIRKGNLAAATVYFREIGSQGGFTLDPSEQYNPASLLKVPTMMAYFKIAEKTPEILNDRLVYTGAADENAQEHLKSQVALVPGRAYTVEELIEHMIEHSDNNAATLLINHLNTTNHENAFNDLFNDLGITEIDLNDDFITAQAYILFFRVLYNATYLSRDMSEKALEILTRTDFADGLKAGIAGSVPIAHKFGEFTQLNQSGALIKHELHDCGYIYYPKHTYSLCVMTKGYDFDKLEGVIQGVSSRIYTFISKEGD